MAENFGNPPNRIQIFVLKILETPPLELRRRRKFGEISEILKTAREARENFWAFLHLVTAFLMKFKHFHKEIWRRRRKFWKPP